ncbi:MAG: hypothetical protein ACYTG0_03035 [Planctomycetota bacterium]|jgi:hypothetical protein
MAIRQLIAGKNDVYGNGHIDHVATGIVAGGSVDMLRFEKPARFLPARLTRCAVTGRSRLTSATAPCRVVVRHMGR